MVKNFFKLINNKSNLAVNPEKIRDIFEDYSKIYFKIDWNKPDSLIYFHQSIYRLFSLVNSDYQVLHGSATVTPRGKVLIFGDDGKSIGKTTCAFEVARHSKRWIADEFVLHHKGRIYANGEYPLHFKNGAKEYFKWLKKDFHYWVYPKKQGWKIINSAKLDAIVCPTLSGKNELRLLRFGAADRARRTTAFAHTAKLIDPSLDRLSIFTGKNDQELAIKDLTDLAGLLKRFKSRVPIYELQFKHSRYIIPLLKKANLY